MFKQDQHALSFVHTPVLIVPLCLFEFSLGHKADSIRFDVAVSLSPESKSESILEVLGLRYCLGPVMVRNGTESRRAAASAFVGSPDTAEHLSHGVCLVAG